MAFVRLLAVSLIAFGGSIQAVATPSQLPFTMRRAPRHGVVTPGNGARASKRAIRRAAYHLGRTGHGPAPDRPLVIAFHAPRDEANIASLGRHVDDLDWVVPGCLSIIGADDRVTSFPDPAGRAILANAAHRPRVLPMVQNALNGAWDGPGMAALPACPDQRRAALDRVAAMLVLNHADGAFFDSEELPLRRAGRLSLLPRGPRRGGVVANGQRGSRDLALLQSP